MRARLLPHLLGWLVAAAVLFGQSWGLTAADTKHDLAAAPGHFLAGALHAWSDVFPLGQLQNQAYGYLFPQGLFFLLTDALPDFIAQRLWWTIVVGVGYSGALFLLGRLGAPLGLRIVAAALFAVSPHTLTTLSTISSETWPTMLAPWAVAIALGRPTARTGFLAAAPVALMGAVNATATLAACLPAGLVLLLRRRPAPLLAWLGGCALVSAWWIGPLLVLGAYAPPFTDYIESATVTTTWLNPAEILRGTTSWAPFVDTERQAGVELVGQPALILLTLAVAGLGLWGLTRAPKAGVWLTMLLVGFAVMGMGYGFYLGFLDGAGAALRNLHKFDVLVRLPLVVGVAFLPVRRRAVMALVVVAAASASAPIVRILPLGAYESVPADWAAATEFLNETQPARTLIYPPASFARQDWGWTRDEPAQPLLDVPWVTRDAVPLVNPEAIRGLDGLAATIENFPEQAANVLVAQGIDAVLLREGETTRLPGEVHRFGELTVILLAGDPPAEASRAVTVAGGGEVVPLLDAATSPTTRRLVAEDAQVVTDTPMLTARNYGAIDSVSAPLASEEEGADVANPVRDYASSGPLTRVVEHGGHLTASTSASDATSFGGSDPAESPTAAVDGHEDTAWYPQPGLGAGQWLEASGVDTESVTITATDDTEVLVGDTRVRLVAGSPRTVTLPRTSTVRITLTERVGIAELTLDQPLERVVTVPDTSPNVEQFFFQRLSVDTGVLIRDFTAPRPMTLVLNGPSDEPVLIDATEYHPGDTVTLEPGVHRLDTEAAWVLLGDAPDPVGGELYLTHLAANPGLRASAGDRELEAVSVDFGMQAFVLPDGVDPGTVTVWFAGESAYRWSLGVGGVVGVLSVLAMAVVGLRRRGRAADADDWEGPGARVVVAVTGVAMAALSWPGLLAWALTWAILRFTTLTPRWLISAGVGMSAAWLARSPWPSATYAGFSPLLAVAALGAVCACSWAVASRGGASANP